MSRTGIVVKIGVSGILVSACSILMTIPVDAATSGASITTSVGKMIDCSKSATTVNIGSVSPGLTASKTFSIQAETNSTSGFMMTASQLNSLVHSSEASYKINYNASAGANTRGYKIVPGTPGEWKTGSTTLSSGSPIAVGSVWTHAGYSATENLTVTVGTDGATVAGTYSGTVVWTCQAI